MNNQELEDAINRMKDSIVVMDALLTRHGRVVSGHSEWLQDHDRAMAAHREWLQEHDKAMTEMRERDKATDERIEKLVSAIGEWIRRSGQEAK